jgi:hypothetical protein
VGSIGVVLFIVLSRRQGYVLVLQRRALYNSLQALQRTIFKMSTDAKYH